MDFDKGFPQGFSQQLLKEDRKIRMLTIKCFLIY